MLPAKNRMKKHNYTVIFLILICSVGTWLRFDGLGWGLPFRLHPDEMKYVQGAAKCHMGEWNPKYFRNPPGYTYTNALWYPVWMYIAPTIEVPNWLEPQPSYTNASDVSTQFYEQPYSFVLGARVISALFGVGMILLTFWIATLLAFHHKTALLASGLTAVSFVGVRESHFAVNDTSMAFWAILAIAVGIYSVKLQSVRWLFCAAVLSGIAVAFKYSAYPAVIVVMLIRLTPLFKLESFSNHTIAMIRDIVVIGFLSVFAFLLICPFPILDTPTFMDEMKKLSTAASAGWQGQDKVWSGFLLLESVIRSEGVLSILMTFFGGYVLIRQKQWLFVLFPALYLLMLIVNPLYFTRFCLPLLPWIALAAAYGLNSLLSHIPSNKYNNTVYGICVTLLILQPFVSSLRSNYLLHQEDTRIQALRWVIENEQQGKIAAGQFELPLVYWDTAEPWSTQYYLNIDPLPSSQLNVLKNYPVNHIAVSSFSAFPGKIPDSFRERLQRVIQYTNTSDPTAIFTVFDRNLQTNSLSSDIVRHVEQADVEDSYSPTTKLWERERTGPEIIFFSIPVHE